MDASELASLEDCAAYCKVDLTDTARMVILDMIRTSVADQVAEYCRKTTGFKAGTKLETLKLIQRELMIYDQGAHGIASENAGGVSTTYVQGWPVDTLAVLDRDKRTVTL